MPTFLQTVNPTPFSYFDADLQFQSAADPMVLFVKRALGDDILSVELTSKQIWMCFEQATLEYGRYIHETNIKSNLVHVLGQSTGSDYTNRYPMQTLEYLVRAAQPYSSLANVGGMYNLKTGYFELEEGRQDYDVYSELLDSDSGLPLYDNLPSGSKGKMKVVEVMHYEPVAAQHFLLNASNVTNFLATNFNYESYVNSTVFYVLPIFEDVLRRQMLKSAFRVRRSNYSYQFVGSKLRIFPIPLRPGYIESMRLYVRLMPQMDPLNPSVGSISGSVDPSVYGVSGPHNMPLNILQFSSITEPGRQWIRQYTLALCTELLGRVRSKIKSIPIPGAELSLDGDDLVSKGREDKEKLATQLKEFLLEMTSDKLFEREALRAESINKQLKFVPMPVGSAIKIGSVCG
jgi:hypothetical protein